MDAIALLIVVSALISGAMGFGTGLFFRRTRLGRNTVAALAAGMVMAAIVLMLFTFLVASRLGSDSPDDLAPILANPAMFVFGWVRPWREHTTRLRQALVRYFSFLFVLAFFAGCGTVSSTQSAPFPTAEDLRLQELRRQAKFVQNTTILDGTCSIFRRHLYAENVLQNLADETAAPEEIQVDSAKFRQLAFQAKTDFDEAAESKNNCPLTQEESNTLQLLKLLGKF